jgi:hypothetical protein
MDYRLSQVRIKKHADQNKAEAIPGDTYGRRFGRQPIPKLSEALRMGARILPGFEEGRVKCDRNNIPLIPIRGRAITRACVAAGYSGPEDLHEVAKFINATWPWTWDYASERTSFCDAGIAIITDVTALSNEGRTMCEIGDWMAGIESNRTY